MDIYGELGVVRRINAVSTYTIYGGSIWAPGVQEAMASASQAYVDLNELQVAVGKEIARLTGNEACFVAGGAAAGLTIVTAAIIAGTQPARIRQLPDTTGMKDEVITFRRQRVVYDQAVRLAGVRFVEVGLNGSNHAWELEAAITGRTAYVLYFAGTHQEENAIPLKQVVAIAHERGVRVVVDAAAQIHPEQNLRHFTREMGADVAIFSGGKGLRGPASTGLVLGRPEIIEACRANSAPNHSLGRPMKVSKEDLCGALAAVRWFVGQDHAAESALRESQCRHIMDAVRDVPGVTVERLFPSSSGQPIPRALVRLAFPQTVTPEELLARLKEGQPSILALPHGKDGVAFFTGTLQPGDENTIGQRLRTVLSGDR
ncbi:MAG TPA: aminotransferase class V-fold PLP-dependent enzyme [Symbiobacteriaceae bacterium]|nr:aminotransferase class V-fold PLP-dependent enzyme [Symbiobacteriaceae bacterium]